MFVPYELSLRKAAEAAAVLTGVEAAGAPSACHSGAHTAAAMDCYCWGAVLRPPVPCKAPRRSRSPRREGSCFYCGRLTPRVGWRRRPRRPRRTRSSTRRGPSGRRTPRRAPCSRRLVPPDTTPLAIAPPADTPGRGRHVPWGFLSKPNGGNWKVCAGRRPTPTAAGPPVTSPARGPAPPPLSWKRPTPLPFPAAAGPSPARPPTSGFPRSVTLDSRQARFRCCSARGRTSPARPRRRHRGRQPRAAQSRRSPRACAPRDPAPDRMLLPLQHRPRTPHLPRPLDGHPASSGRLRGSRFLSQRGEEKARCPVAYPAFSAGPGGPFHFPLSLSFLLPGAAAESSSNTLKSSSPKASAIFRRCSPTRCYPQCSAPTPAVTLVGLDGGPRETKVVESSSRRETSLSSLS